MTGSLALREKEKLRLGAAAAAVDRDLAVDDLGYHRQTVMTGDS